MKLNIIKWRLMLTTLPITALIFLIKLGIVFGLHYDGLVKFSEINLVITGGIFLVGFMLAGTITDYKESEKIPAEMASTMEAIEDTVTLAHGFKGSFDLSEQVKQLNGVNESILNWFNHRESETDVYQKIKSITSIALLVEKTGLGSTSQRVTVEQANLRKLFSRASVIQRTHFLSTGYAFLELFTVVIIGILLISKFENQVTGTIIILFISQIFIYMVRLIKDVDHPFEYPVDGIQRAADIELFPLIEYNDRLKQRI